MLYSWKDPKHFLNRDIGEYNRDCSPDRFLLYAGRLLGADEFNSIATVNFEVSKNQISKFDCLPNNGSSPIVNYRVKCILEKIAADDVQFFPVKLICSDGELEDYYILNITHTIVGIDHEQSIYTKMKMVDAISGFHYLTYKNGCMGPHLLARDKEYKANLLVSEEIKSIFDKEKITGVRLVRPEDFYRPLTASDLINEQ